MLSQQLKSMHSLHLEDVSESIDNPSITVANNGYYDKHVVQISKTDRTTTTLSPSLAISSSKISKTDTEKQLLHLCNNLNNLSQCTQFLRFGNNSTLLDKLWYTYSYIYKVTAPTATIFYKLILALLLLLLILMPTTSSSLHQLSSIVSPSPNPLSRTRSFTMANYTAITQLYFIFGPHHLPKYEFLDTALNNVYS